MDIVGVTVIGRTDGDHGTQLRRLQSGQLQAVESAPANPDDAASTVAPWLLLKPAKDLETIGKFLGRVLVRQHALAVSGATNVDPDASVTVSGVVRVRHRVARDGPIAFSVR